MCGIAGFVNLVPEGLGAQALRRMAAAIRHRGPDASGEYLQGAVGLCHQRLSVIDLSEAANQPMHSASGRFVITFNGEIYNYRSLRAELQALGRAFRTESDTEVLLALYEEFGSECVPKLNGMFAFAIWDTERRTLFLARDRLGKKPLYYYRDERLFAFASEAKALLQLPGADRAIRPDAVVDYFFHQYVPDPKSIFRRIDKVRPGCWMEFDGRGVVERSYWDVSFRQKTSLCEEEAAEELKGLLRQAVHDRMISDVPLGAFLSGGIDSSAVVAMMSRQSDAPVKTCSIGFNSAEHDEVEYAARVARLFRTDHVELTVAETVQDNLEAIAAFFDEPFADPSLVPTYFVSQLARSQVTVALAGDGGDENFAGYSKYVTDASEYRLRSLVPAPLRRSLVPVLSAATAKGVAPLARKATSLLRSIEADPARAFFLTNSFFDPKLWGELVNADFARCTSGYDPAETMIRYYQQADSGEHLDRVLYTDIKSYLAGDILTKVDRMSMAHALETRAPLLDYRIVEFAASLPGRLKLRHGEKKYLLKRALRGVLPDDILHRPKMGFSVPLARWLRHELKDLAGRHLMSPTAGLTNFFKHDAITHLWERHQRGDNRHTAEIWSLLMFELWWQGYMEKKAAFVP